jgi:hypothetical protein
VSEQASVEARLRAWAEGDQNTSPDELLLEAAAALERAERERDDARFALDGSHARGYREGVREEQARAEARAQKAEALCREYEKRLGIPAFVAYDEPPTGEGGVT